MDISKLGHPLVPYCLNKTVSGNSCALKKHVQNKTFSKTEPIIIIIRTVCFLLHVHIGKTLMKCTHVFVDCCTFITINVY